MTNKEIKRLENYVNLSNELRKDAYKAHGQYSEKYKSATIRSCEAEYIFYLMTGLHYSEDGKHYAD